MKLMICWMTAALVLTASTLAGARTKAVDAALGPITTEIASIPFGQDMAATHQWANRVLTRRYEPLIAAASNERRRDALQAKLRRELDRLAEGPIRIDEEAAHAYRKTAAAGEFRVDGRDELQRITLAGKVYYLVFRKGSLRKVVRPAGKDLDSTFRRSVRAVSRELEVPRSTTHRLTKRGKRLTAATWSAAMVSLRAKRGARRRGGNAIVIEDAPIFRTVASAH